MHPRSRWWEALTALPLLTCCLIPSRVVAAPPPPVITRPEAVTPWLLAAATGRADVVCLGDSNQLLQSTGWDHGWIRALEARFGLYATGLLSAGENAGNGAGSGYQYSVGGTSSIGQFQYQGAPPVLDRFLQPGIGMAPLNYLYLPDGAAAGAGATYGFFIDRYSGIDVNAPLRFHLIHGTFETGSPGVFQLTVRQGVAPYQTIAVAAPQFTVTGSFGIAEATLDLPAATRETYLNFRYSYFDQNIAGPFIAYYVRAENLARPVGTALHTLYAYGGQSAHDMAEALRAADLSYLTLYFKNVRALQGPAPRILVRINTGLNDRNENLPSVQNGIAPGNSPEAVYDNLEAIVLRIREVWTANDWPEDELYFLFTLSHPVATPDDSLLVAYREQAAALASVTPRCAAINLGSLTAWAEMRNNGWYLFGGFDTNHLTVTGYEALAARELAALENGAAWRDLNGDRRIDAEDLYEWHRLRPDLDGDGIATYADLRALQQAVRALEADDTSDGIPSPLALP
ncbi:MAG: hypothetical protein JNK58_10165 [Phycisphaerae bacterium]|nr:hypothetical protein [Phycisphaerae bacterium]